MQLAVSSMQQALSSMQQDVHSINLRVWYIFLIWTGIVFLTGQVFLSQNGQRGSLLVCDWLHFVGQNHFYVMMLFNRVLVIFRVFISELCF